MNLIDDAWKEFKRLWTIRILLLSTLFSSIAGFLFIFQEWMSPVMYAGINIAFNIAAVIARMVSQNRKEEYGNDPNSQFVD